ncbi:MAG TPA: peptide ABC transporter substrate-binding protein [Gemmatimonadales bacterium]|nr:peptide ABC transporter substrate-binding protein [Gemmatimonadales bacterium]
MAATPLSLLAGFALIWCGTGCGERQPCARCETLVIAATGEPATLLPPLVGETVGRDVSDLIYERLAELPGGASPLDSSLYQAGLAERWERVDSLTLRFHLRQGALWHDGVSVTAGDVVFSFVAYADSSLDASARQALAGRLSASAPDDSTVLIRFRAPDPEQWYDATWHVRILPRHVWDSIPRSRWSSDTSVVHLIGSGPYRLEQWVKGQSLALERASKDSPPTIQRVIWRFAGEQDAALNLLLSHEADLLESIGDSARVARVAADPSLTTLSYPSAVYGFLGFNLGESSTAPERELTVRRALALATDRPRAARGALGPGAVAPPGPMSRILWISDAGVSLPGYDTVTAGKLLDAAGWRTDPGHPRHRQGKLLAIDILVPGTSVARRNLAQILQEMWRKIGVSATITSVDFPVFQQRLRTHHFETYVGAWLDEPSPRQLADQWTTAGIGARNYGRYRNPVFDSLFRRAAEFRGTPTQAKAAWREALDTLNAAVPAIWLYNPTNVAGAAKRIEAIRIDPYSWLAGLRKWSLTDSKR